MKWFLKSKNWIAILLCTLFFAACKTAAQPQGFDVTSESAWQNSASEISSGEDVEEASSLQTEGKKSEPDEERADLPDNRETLSAYEESSSQKNQQAPQINSNSGANNNAQVSSGSASSRPQTASSAPAGSKPTVNSTTPQSSKPTPSSSAPASSKPSVSSSAPVSSKPQTNNSQTDQLAAQVVALVNQERAKQGLSPLAADSNLASSALIRSQEIVTKFAHERPNGEQGYQMAFRAGFSVVGENIAYGYSTAESVMNAWMNSEGHRANILNSNFTHIGVGCYRASNGQLYWTQLFGG